MKKNLASKSLKVPEAVVTVIKAVFLDKTHTYKEFKKEQELACIEFRKWMIEQRGKLKKDPLPPAKVEVSKKWLFKSPGGAIRFARKKGQLPSVVMDECLEPVPGVAFTSEAGSSSSSSSSTSASGKSGNGSTQNNSIVTSSMINWEKTRAQVAADATLSAAAAAASGSSNKQSKAGAAFKVDDVDMFVASQPQKDYFVVI